MSQSQQSQVQVGVTIGVAIEKHVALFVARFHLETPQLAVPTSSEKAQGANLKDPIVKAWV